MVSKLRAIIVCAAIAAVSLGSSVAYGQSAADRETARGLMDLGRNKYEEGDHAAALNAFAGADRIMRLTSTGLWVGKALIKLGRLVEARDKLIEVRRLPTDADGSSVLSIARDEAEKLQLDLADRIPQIEVRVSGLHPGAKADIHIGATAISLEALELPRKVNPGDHLITATSPGYGPLSVRVTAAESQRHKVELAFVQTGAVPTEDANHADSSPNIPMWIAFGTAGLGVIVGTVTGAISLAAASSAKDGCNAEGADCPSANQGDADTSLATAHVSTTSFVVAALAGGLGLVFLLTDEDTADEARLIPLVGPGALGLRGRF
jgi:hypothetical protein